MNLEQFNTSHDKEIGLLEDRELEGMSPEEIKSLGEDVKENLVALKDFIEKNFAGAITVVAGAVAVAITKITNDPSSAVAVGAGASLLFLVASRVAKFLEGSPKEA